jgi:hypothetical protein
MSETISRDRVAVAAGGPESAIQEPATVRAGLRPRVLHPFLLAAFPIVSLYSHNVYELQPSIVAIPIALAVGSTFVVWLALRMILHDASKAGLSATLLVASWFGFKQADDLCYQIGVALSKFWIFDPDRQNPLITVLWLIVINLAAIVVLARWGKHAALLTPTLNVFAALLVVIPGASAIWMRMNESFEPRRETAVPTVVSRGSKPDIYFIVLDGYARTDVMKELYGFDNEPFLQRLERSGFFVSRQSYSNYCQTRLSLASTLNANYVDTIVSPGSADLLPLDDAIHSNLVRRTLKPLGYKFVSFATDFSPTEILDADVFLRPDTPRAGFFQLLVEMTPLAAWRSEVQHNDRFRTLRDRILFVFDHLRDVPAIPEPTFTFVHLMAPHPPFVFGEHGEDVSPRSLPQGGCIPHRSDRADDR